MDPRFLRCAGLAAAVSLALPACSDTTSTGSPGAFGGGAAASIAGGITRAAGTSTGQSYATGVSSGAIVGMTAYILSKHKATPQQRAVAVQRAKKVYAAMPPKKKAAMKTQKKKYIAVETVKSEEAPPKARKSVMLFDTEAQDVVGNDVYDVSATPSIGSTAQFETYSAEYVGAGT